MVRDILNYLPLVGILLCGIGVYIINKKIHYKKVTESLLKWTNKSGYELLDFKLDRNHTGPFMFDDIDDILPGKSKKKVYIVKYKNREGKICSGYILYGQSGLNLSGNDIVFEPIEEK